MIVNTPGGDDDYGAVCFWLNAANNEVSYNRGINCKAPSFDYVYDGGFVEVSKQGTNSYIHHNYAENTNGFIELGGSGSAQNVKIAYNVMVNTGDAVCAATGIDVVDFKFENNTFVNTFGATDGSRDRVFQCRTDLSPLQVRNNIFYSNIQIADNGNFTHTNNLYYMIDGADVGYTLGPGEKTGNPLFVNVGAGDFHLQAGSPAIDAGLCLGYTKDFENKTVPVGAAPEFQPLGKRRCPAVDRSVRAHPQRLPLGTLRRRAQRSQIRELPRDEPGIRALRTVQPPSQPLRARGAERAVSVVDDPGHVANHCIHAFNLSAAWEVVRIP